MTSQGFSFPPPPPPPPTSQQPAYPPSAPPGQWNGRGAGGRGRGRGNRGRGGGGHHHPDSGRSSYPNNSGYNYAPRNYGYPAQPAPPTPYMTPPPYPHQQSNYQHPPNPSQYQSPQPFSQPAGSPAYQPLPGFNTPNIGHSTYSTPPTTPYPPGPSTHQHASPPANPMMMGAMPWGSEMQAPPGSYGGAPPAHGRGSWPQQHGNNGPKSRNHHKRDHSSAFHKPQSTAPRTPAAPAVPSFGNPLPSKPPPAADATRKPKKRKRKHNQLGLTPKTEDHESSEEEEDADEESKLAQPGTGAASLQFMYKGQTAKLQSAADIAAWIAERRKKFPTQARVDEKKKAMEEAKAARDAAREAVRLEKEKEREKFKQKQLEQKSEEAADPALDEAMKAQRKADKIRRNLDREQKRFAKAEAAAEAARLKVEALQRQAQGLNEPTQVNGSVAPESKPEADQKNEASDSADAVDPMALDAMDTAKAVDSQLVDTSSIPAETVNATVNRLESGMDLSSDVSDANDWTSSSGSESEFESDSDVDAAPEEASSRRQGPERVPPPPRESKKIRCRHFARSGQCNRGDSCQFSHEASERGPKAKAKTVEKKGRKGLLQALLDRQKEDEDRRAMEVISWLGQNGLLEPSISSQANGAPQ
ncbi:hypothetical protein N7448_008236 [Penicillium atrosanguineum]|uniref:Uncharacterized protein n=1 Tax=Penicillium atrosanguineum TaxID=1132637 RepID=A0A9W9UC08_9EURO|nr:hypothetical protein N7448_008236 [Penicillium atrosanguineum]KAJ5331037.1 hypothetical protein N7476_000820 [Penicillium atrosanguineum]